MKSRLRAETSLVNTFMLSCAFHFMMCDNNNNNNYEKNKNYDNGEGNGIGTAVINFLDTTEDDVRFAFIIW